jgi:DNA-binding MarR family transcriptional regulator
LASASVIDLTGSCPLISTSLLPDEGGPDFLPQPTEFDLERRILVAMRRMIRAIDLYSRRLVALHQITGPQLLCLNQLAESNGLTVGELAGEIHLSPSTVVRILDRLEIKGLVRRERSTGDRRRVIVSVTETGRQFSLLTPYSDRHPLRQALQELAIEDRRKLAELLDALVAIMAAPPLPGAQVPPLDVLLTETESMQRQGKDQQEEP